MTLQTGTKLGPYEILAALGSGGMGEVYRAKDTRLNRTVAIKVLPSHLSSNPDLRQRFEREARTVSSLNHPHICTLHDIGHQDGIDFIVMEYIEGETLTHRLQKGPLPPAEVLQYSIHVADALDKAHRKGIVHRDLKPGNIMLTKSGAKLLDFGLAKGKLPGADASGASAMPTQSGPLTAEGTILGTLPYMAPEQVEGKEADARTDIWSFGTVVYEMATSKRAFDGKSQASLITAIMSSEPAPVSTLQPLSPPVLDQVVKTCLAKDPDDRFQSAHDLMLELRWISEGTTAAVPVRTVTLEPKLRWIAAVLTALIVGLIAGWGISRKPSTVPSATVIRSVLPLPPGTHLSGWASPVVTFSPDGKKIAFIVENKDNVYQLYLQSLDRNTAQLLPDSEEAEGPFFSPDSQWIGFAVGVSGGVKKGELKKYSLVSGLTQTICETLDYFGADWGRDDFIIFSSEGGRLRKVSANGGKAEYLVPMAGRDSEKKYLVGAWPQILPDGKWILTSNDVAPRTLLINISSGELKDLNLTSVYTRFAWTNHLLYVRPDATLMAVPFDPESLKITAPSVALLSDICLSGAGAAVLSVSQNGSLIYTTGYVRRSGREPMNLARISRSGKVELLPVEPDLFGRFPAVSRDGKKLAVTTWSGDLWVYDLKRNTRTNLPQGKTLGGDYPLWTPDGKTIVFGSLSGQEDDLFSQVADGVQEPQRLNAGEGESHPYSWTADGRTLLYDLFSEKAGGIYLLPLSPNASPKLLLGGPKTDYRNPVVSPDEQWLAYVSAETGTLEVFVQKFPELGDKIQISKGGGWYPKWSATGRELIYRNNKRFLSVAVTTSPEFRAGEPQLLFELDDIRGFDIAPDGTFYAIRRVPGAGVQTQLNLVVNWFDELKRLAPKSPKK